MFMVVHTSTPIQAMMGDMGWTDIYIYIKELLCMLRYWNKVIIMDNARLERRILCGITTKEVIIGVIRFQLFLIVYIVCMYIEEKNMV